MFKETYGFDVDLLSFKTPIYIDDNELPPGNSRLLSFSYESDGMDYKYTNKKGVYLIKESSSTILRLTSVGGEEVKLPIRHFIGDKPRMKISIYAK